MPAVKTKEDRLYCRITKEQKRMIERGAAAMRQKTSDFVVSSACQKAEEVLADQKHFILPKSKWDAFMAALDRPVRQHQRLARLMSEPSILEQR